MTREEILKKYRIKSVEQTTSGWKVESTSGSTYTVADKTSVGRYDGSVYFTRTCNCPARKPCRHMDAVEAIQRLEAAESGDYDGLDVLDRIEDEPAPWE